MGANPSPAVQNIGTDKLLPSPWQTRHFPKKNPELLDLAASIQQLGMLQPILVRPKGKQFEILAGERRMRAAKLAKLQAVPAIVREVDDDTAAEICITENLQREDLGVIEEGHAVALLLERDGWNAETVAAQVGRTPAWVARRASLWTRLSDKWKKVASTVGHPAHSWPAASLELVARLEAKQQDGLLKGHVAKHTGDWFWRRSASDLRNEIEREHMRKLGTAPFDLASAELVPGAGACTACPHRASQVPLLFDNLKPGDTKADQCLLPSCWAGKLLAHFKATLAAWKEKHGKPPGILTGYYGGVHEKLPGKLTTFSRWEVGPLKVRAFKGSTPVLVCDPDSPHYGRVMQTKKQARGSTTYRKSIEEKRRELMLKRLRDGTGAVVDAVKAAQKQPKPKEIWALLALMDMDRGVHAGDGVDVLAQFDEAMTSTRALNALARLWWQEQLAGLMNQLYFWDQEGGERAVAIAARAAGLVGVDPAPLVAAAIEANPEPASWAKKKKPAKKKAKKKAAKKVTKKKGGTE